MNPTLQHVRALGSAMAVGLLLFAVGCDKKTAAAGPPPGPVEVGVVTVEPRDVTLATELPGRLSAFRVAEVRARVNGVVLQRLFTEGADVKEGEALFRIDPAPLEAEAARARATLLRAEATAANAKVQSDRAAQLVKEGVGSKQDQDNAEAARRVAEAEVGAAQAALRAAAINLSFTNVTSPIAGRIGRAAVTEGAFAQASSATLMATVQQLDPMFVDLTWSSVEALRLRRDLEAGKLQGQGDGAPIAIVLEDGTLYPERGRLQFTDVTVDPTTGSVTLRAIVPNPKKLLLPGMFVRARIEEGKKPGAIVVPQRGVTRDGAGNASALVATGENKAERRKIVAEREVEGGWLVTSGIAAGDKIIVEGLQKVRPGGDVKTVPAKAAGSGAPAADAAAPADSVGKSTAAPPTSSAQAAPPPANPQAPSPRN
jgi:membrane fusion protein (multidrug efflux system)